MYQAEMLHDVEVADVARGVRLVHVRSSSPIAFVSLWYDFGGRNDPKGKEGLAHFAEHLALKTSDRFPTVADVQLFRAANGLHCNAFTSPSSMHFQYSCEARNAILALRHCVDMLRTSHVTAHAFFAERAVIADERARSMQEPKRALHTLVREALFPGHALHVGNLGTDTSLGNVSFLDVREFVQAKVIDGPKTFVVISPFAISELVSALDGVPPALGPLTVEFDPVVGETKPSIIGKNGSNTVSVALAFRTCDEGNRIDRTILGFLASSYLASNSASRLASRLRTENQLTYGVGAETYYYQETGMFTVLYTVAKERLRESIAICREEFEKLRRGEVDSEALAAAKRSRRFGLLNACLDPEWVGAWYAGQRRSGTFHHRIDDELAAVDRLTAADLSRVANAYFVPESMSVVLLGNVEEGDLKENCA